MTIPATMQALELSEHIKDYSNLRTSLRLTEKPVPTPADGEVLIKVAASPIHPSDLMTLKGLYGTPKSTPFVPGFEGSGVVVAAGSGMLGRAYVGRRVCFVAGSSGAWAEYTTAPILQVIPLLPKTSLTTGAMLFVNPMTALALVDMARSERASAIVQTAAASAVGKMIIHLAKQAGLPLINVVRGKAQVENLQALGATYVLDSNDPDFSQALGKLSSQLKATIAFDAVAGEMTEHLLNTMPDGSKIILYGALSESGLTADPRCFIFAGKTVTGFWLPIWAAQRNILQHLQMAFKIQRLSQTVLQTKIQRCVPLDQGVEAIIDYTNHMSAGKVLLTPQNLHQT